MCMYIYIYIYNLYILHYITALCNNVTVLYVYLHTIWKWPAQDKTITMFSMIPTWTTSLEVWSVSQDHDAAKHMCLTLWRGNKISTKCFQEAWTCPAIAPEFTSTSGSVKQCVLSPATTACRRVPGQWLDTPNFAAPQWRLLHWHQWHRWRCHLRSFWFFTIQNFVLWCFLPGMVWKFQRKWNRLRCVTENLAINMFINMLTWELYINLSNCSVVAAPYVYDVSSLNEQVQLPFASSSPMFTGNNTLIFPHIFVWGSCFWFCIPACPVPVLSSRRLPHTKLVHTQLTHTQLVNTQLTHTHNLLTHNLSTHNLLTHNLSTHTTCSHRTYSHTTSSHTSCPTQLAHTHNLLSHNLQLTPASQTQLVHTTCPHTTYSHTTYSHTTYSHTTYSHTHTTYSYTSCLTHNLSTHNSSTHNLPTHNLLTHNLLSHNLLAHNLLSHFLSTHTTYSHTTCPHNLLTHTTFPHTTNNLLTHNLLSRGRRGTWWHGPPLGVAGVALGDIDVHSAWQAWHLRHWAGAGGALGAWFAVGAVVAAAVCVAGVALGDIDLHLAWQAWRLATSACTLRHRPPLGDIIVHFAWQAWHLRHSPGARGALRFQWTPLSPWLFAWQAWHLATLTSALRGTRGTWQHGPPRLALVARLVPSGRRCRCCCLPGRRGRRCVCATPWSLSRCAVAVSLHLPGEWLPADIEVGMSTPDAFSALTEQKLLSHLQPWTGKCHIARWTTVAPWRPWMRCKFMPSLDWFRGWNGS